MKKNKFTLSLILLFILIGCSDNIFDPNIKQKREKQAREIFENIALWYIQDGIAEYYKTGRSEHVGNFVKQKEAQLYTDVLISKDGKKYFEEEGFVTQIISQKWWMGSTVTCYSRLKEKKIYEYWVFDWYGGTRSDVENEGLNFIITESESSNGRRKVIFRTDKFMPMYKLSDKLTIEFPTKNNKSLYHLRFWQYPKSFAGTELENLKIIIQDNQYVKIQASAPPLKKP